MDKNKLNIKTGQNAKDVEHKNYNISITKKNLIEIYSKNQKAHNDINQRSRQYILFDDEIENDANLKHIMQALRDLVQLLDSQNYTKLVLLQGKNSYMVHRLLNSDQCKSNEPVKQLIEQNDGVDLCVALDLLNSGKSIFTIDNLFSSGRRTWLTNSYLMNVIGIKLSPLKLFDNGNMLIDHMSNNYKRIPDQPELAVRKLYQSDMQVISHENIKKPNRSGHIELLSYQYNPHFMIVGWSKCCEFMVYLMTCLISCLLPMQVISVPTKLLVIVLGDHLRRLDAFLYVRQIVSDEIVQMINSALNVFSTVFAMAFILEDMVALFVTGATVLAVELIYTLCETKDLSGLYTTFTSKFLTKANFIFEGLCDHTLLAFNYFIYSSFSFVYGCDTTLSRTQSVCSIGFYDDPAYNSRTPGGTSSTFFGGHSFSPVR